MAKWPDLTGTGMLHTQLQQRTGPTINRGKGNNNASTPWKFINAVVKKFGPLAIDLAASLRNTRVPAFLGPGSLIAEDSLTVDWAYHTRYGLVWNNPPLTNITPWARYHAEQVQLGARTLLLVPASVGSNWYWQWVVPFADVYSAGRMVFDDCYDKHGELITTPYPKDLVLAHYDWSREAKKAGARTGSSNSNTGYLIRWRWQDA